MIYNNAETENKQRFGWTQITWKISLSWSYITKKISSKLELSFLLRKFWQQFNIVFAASSGE